MAGHGTDHRGVGPCRFHLGNTPTHRAAGARALAEADAARFGHPRVVDHHHALLEELHRTAGYVSWWEAQAQADEAAGALAVDGAPGFALGRLDVERRHYRDAALACAKAGIEERRVRVAEEQGAIFAAVLRSIIGGIGTLLGLDLLDDRRVLDLVRAELGAIDATTGGNAP